MINLVNYSTLLPYGCRITFQLEIVYRNFVTGLLWVSKQVFRLLPSSFLLPVQGGTVGLMPGLGENKQMIFEWEASQTGHTVQGC